MVDRCGSRIASPKHSLTSTAKLERRFWSFARRGHRRLGRCLPRYCRPREPRAPMASTRQVARSQRGTRQSACTSPHDLPRVCDTARQVACTRVALSRARPQRRRRPRPRRPGPSVARESNCRRRGSRRCGSCFGWAPLHAVVFRRKQPNANTCYQRTHRHRYWSRCRNLAWCRTRPSHQRTRNRGSVCCPRPGGSSDCSRSRQAAL